MRYEKQLKTINIIESESGIKEAELELLKESLSFQEREKRFFEERSLAVMALEYEYLIESAEISNDNATLFVTEIITSITPKDLVDEGGLNPYMVASLGIKNIRDVAMPKIDTNLNALVFTVTSVERTFY